MTSCPTNTWSQQCLFLSSFLLLPLGCMRTLLTVRPNWPLLMHPLFPLCAAGHCRCLFLEMVPLLKPPPSFSLASLSHRLLNCLSSSPVSQKQRNCYTSSVCLFCVASLLRYIKQLQTPSPSCPLLRLLDSSASHSGTFP